MRRRRWRWRGMIRYAAFHPRLEVTFQKDPMSFAVVAVTILARPSVVVALLPWGRRRWSWGWRRRRGCRRRRRRRPRCTAFIAVWSGTQTINPVPRTVLRILIKALPPSKIAGFRARWWRRRGWRRFFAAHDIIGAWTETCG